MRPYPFDPATTPPAKPLRGYDPAAYGPTEPPPPPPPPPPNYDREPDDYSKDSVRPRRGSRWRWPMRIAGLGIVLFVLAVIWLAFTAPLSKSLEPLTPPSITLLAEDNTPIARRGAIIGQPVDAAKLPANVTNAFLAIEDRRFKSHWGIDPRGIARAFWHNVRRAGEARAAARSRSSSRKMPFSIRIAPPRARSARS